jgi:hypothetical protein
MSQITEQTDWVRCEPADATLIATTSAFGSLRVETSDHIGIPLSCRWIAKDDVTDWPGAAKLAMERLAHEVMRLRDEISNLTGLTRQEIARGIGVDRRSLSGFVAGDIRPTPARLESLRLLAEVSRRVAQAYGDRAREAMREQREGRSVLDDVAEGRVDGVSELLARARPTDVVVSTRRLKRDPLYLKARERWSDRVDLPVRTGELRDPDTYVQSLDEPGSYAEPEDDSPRRSGLR